MKDRHNTSLRVSIDIDAEIRKISREQHLNDVHYIIQMIRHAVIHHPKHITITSSSRRLRLYQNGSSIHPDEWHLISLLCDIRPSSDTAIHDAIRRMELQYGIALLSVIRSFRHTEIINGTEHLIIRDGKAILEQCSPRDGYTVSIFQGTRDRRREWRELVYFCSECTIPIIYNGKTIRDSRPIYDLILKIHDKSDNGSGECGIPRGGSMSRLDYRKTGIRFGTKSEIPNDGRVIHGEFDSAIPKFEPHYRASIHNADDFFHTAASRLYGRSLSLFPDLTATDKIRLKQLLFNTSGTDVLFIWKNVPIFHSVHGPFRLSLAHVEKLVTWFGYVPYSAEKDISLPAYIPQLNSSDIRFLRDRIGHSIRSIPHVQKSLSIRRPGISDSVRRNDDISHRSATSFSNHDLAEFIRLLNDSSLPYEFTVGEQWDKREDESGVKHIEIQQDSRFFIDALDTWKRNPETISVWRWRMIGAVT